MDKSRRLAYSSARRGQSEYMAMIAENQIRSDYSPVVAMRLEAGGKVWRISKLGPGHFVPSKHIEIPAGPGEIVMTVEGQERAMESSHPQRRLPVRQ